jgi:hypothetical protein
MQMDNPAADNAVWPAGTGVQVRTRFDESWASGFEIAGAQPAGRSAHPAYRLRRISDNEILPALFPATAVRPAP